LVHAFPLSLEESSMAERPPEEPSFARDRYENAETALGGADAVE
jgi:hypothetical protein